jgi:hypothetical protein
VSYQNAFVTVKVSDRQQVIVERAKAVRDFELSGEEATLFARLFLGNQPLPDDLPDGCLAELAGFEGVAHGLQDYF